MPDIDYHAEIAHFNALTDAMIAKCKEQVYATNADHRARTLAVLDGTHDVLEVFVERLLGIDRLNAGRRSGRPKDHSPFVAEVQERTNRLFRTALRLLDN
jgi:hypothetical protein